MAKATGPTYKVSFKRRRKNLTNYRKRLALLKSNLPRFVVRKSNKIILTHVVEFNEKFDKTLVMVDSKELKKYNWPSRANLPTAYLTGYLCGKRAIKKNIKKMVMDIGLASPTKCSFAFAALKGALDAGANIAHGEIEFDEERISGKHIVEYAKSTAGTETYNKLFSGYIKTGVKPENLQTMFLDIKKKIAE